MNPMERNDAVKVGMISLGCNKNQVDAELMLGSLAREGFVISDDQDDCDVIIVNTCGFIESAKKESIENILECCRLKEQGKIKLVVVTGCLAERYRDEVAQLIPEADVILGIGANDEIASAIRTALSGKKIACFYAPENLVTEGDRILVNDPHYAYIRIADGCDNRCAYCAIPMIRGRYRSRSMDKILAECSELAEKGVKEFIIIAQDTTRYGVDIYGKRMLPELLRAICRIDGVKWVRLLYAYPERVTEELLDVFAEEEKMVKYIDIPLQHCNGEVLKNMNRRGNRESLTALLNKIKAKIPNVIFRSTFITGFPGETEEQFEELADFAAEIKFQRLGCFPYSKEEDTKAFLMENQIDDDIKQKRADIIMEHQQSVMAEYCESLIGSEVEVLVEGYDKLAECFFGRTYADAPEVDGCVFFTCNGEKPKAGDFVKVKINDYMGCDPVGERV